MITIINATNLLGDSLYCLQPIKQYLDRHLDEQTILVADRGLAYQMFVDTFGRLSLFENGNIYDDIDAAIAGQSEGIDARIIRLDAGSSGHWCFTQAQQTGKQPHISEGFANMLGFTLQHPIIPYAPWNNWETLETPPPIRIGIAPFSRSCSRHSGKLPNKTLDDYKWMPIIAFLRMHCDEFYVFGGPKDALTGNDISEDERYVAASFKALRSTLKSLHCFITVDNGLGHLASVLGVPTIILWPQVSSVEFIAPIWAPNTQLMTNMDPNLATAAVLLTGLRIFVRDKLNNKITNEDAYANLKPKE